MNGNGVKLKPEQRISRREEVLLFLVSLFSLPLCYLFTSSTFLFFFFFFIFLFFFLLFIFYLYRLKVKQPQMKHLWPTKSHNNKVIFWCDHNNKVILLKKSDIFIKLCFLFFDETSFNYVGVIMIFLSHFIILIFIIKSRD